MPLILATNSDTPGAPGEPEIFASLQGEGPSVGMPVAFLRLSNCNLACKWCDTAYTWHFDGDNHAHRDGATFDRRANQVTLSVADTAERITALDQKRLVITGGEPMLQAGALAQLLEYLPDMQVEIETNGTIAAPARLDIRIDQYNVSPKLSHSGNHARQALVSTVLDAYASDPRAFFKFVVASEKDVAEVVALQRQYRFKPGHVFLMPEGTDSTILRERMEWISPLCLEHGFRLSDRLHIHLYGDTRGT